MCELTDRWVSAWHSAWKTRCIRCTPGFHNAFHWKCLHTRGRQDLVRSSSIATESRSWKTCHASQIEKTRKRKRVEGVGGSSVELTVETLEQHWLEWNWKERRWWKKTGRKVVGIRLGSCGARGVADRELIMLTLSATRNSISWQVTLYKPCFEGGSNNLMGLIYRLSSFNVRQHSPILQSDCLSR